MTERQQDRFASELRKASKAAAVPGERGLDMAEAAVKLGISESQVRRLMAEGKLPKRRLMEERPVFLASELDDYLRGLPVEERPPGRPKAGASAPEPRRQPLPKQGPKRARRAR